jgi:hypothetical protein
MTVIFKYSLQGATPQVYELPCAVQANAANAFAENDTDDLGYIDSSSDSTAVTLVTLVGVTEEAVDNSGGSAGDLFIPVNVAVDCVYEISCTGTMAQAQVFKTVAAETGNLTIACTSAVTNSTGVVKTLKFVSSSLALAVTKRGGPMT